MVSKAWINKNSVFCDNCQTFFTLNRFEAGSDGSLHVAHANKEEAYARALFY